jgi:hypothetical protein
MTAEPAMAAPFPPPSPLVVAALDDLRLAAESPPQTPAELRRVALLPRPWDPPTCPVELRRLVYAWLDDVVGWINHEHTWRTDRVLPLCWVDHPHIVHELATVACLRWEAGYAASAAVLEDWHKYTLPGFLDRLAQRTGNGCPPGKHQAFPGRARADLYRQSAAACERRARRQRDDQNAAT